MIFLLLIMFQATQPVAKPVIKPVTSTHVIRPEDQRQAEHWMTPDGKRCGSIHNIFTISSPKSNPVSVGWVASINIDEFGRFKTSTFATRDLASAMVETYCPSK